MPSRALNNSRHRVNTDYHRITTEYHRITTDYHRTTTDYHRITTDYHRDNSPRRAYCRAHARVPTYEHRVLRAQVAVAERQGGISQRRPARHHAPRAPVRAAQQLARIGRGSDHL